MSPPPEPRIPDLDALDPGDVLALIAALSLHVGDLSALDLDLQLDPLTSRMPGGGWTDEQRATGNAVALDLLARARAIPEPVMEADEATRRRIIEWLAGQPLDDDMHGMLADELALDDDSRAPSWHCADTGAPPQRVAVIGAGMSGILAAHRLLQAGADVTVFDKNEGAGGTWFENTYPGCRVDVPNHVYAYSNAQRPDWTHHHSTQPELRAYFQDCAREWGVLDVARFSTEVTEMRWDEDTNEWLVTSVHDGETSVERFDAVVCAVGQLNRPILPDIEGRERFAGLAFHTARWPADLDLTGKRVGVIGTGASAMQAIPEIAREAGHVTVFQRTPAWLVNRPRYHAPVSADLIALFEEFPPFLHWYRAQMFWAIHGGSLDTVVLDPDWDGSLERSVNAMSEMARSMFEAYIEEQFADRPDLLAKVMPNYPVGAKRFILDNGIWAETLKRDNVDLVTDPIVEIDETGVVSEAGRHDVDVLIYGTGFAASAFLAPMTVIGRGGADLREGWGDDARAYYGMTVPGFPNFFCLYGPNTNIVVNGSIIFFSECAVRYIVEALGQLRRDGLSALDVRPEVHAAQAEKVDEANARMAWGLSSVNSWYKSPSGKVAQNWPFPLVDYWAATREPDPADYERW